MRIRAILCTLLVLPAMVGACGPAPRRGASAHPPPAAQPAPPREARAAGELEIALRLRGWDGALAGGRILVVDPGAHSISAHAVEDGRLLWRTPVAERPSGRQTFIFREGAALFWGGNQMHRLGLGAGPIESTVEAAWNGDCSFDQEGGACAYACQCHLQLADCGTGRKIGPVYEKTYIEEWGPGDEPPTAGCFGSGVGLLAGGGGMAVIRVEDMKADSASFFGRPRIVLGVEAASGRELWRSKELGAIDAGAGSGASADGRHCWIADRYGALRVFACATGAIRWSREGPPGDEPAERHLVRWIEPEGALFRLDDQGATLHDKDTGAPRWSVAVPPGDWALPVGAPMGLYQIDTDDAPQRLHLLAPRDGVEVALIPLPPRADAMDDPGGGFYVRATEAGLVAYDPGGRERGRIPPEIPPNPQAGSDFLAMFDADRLVLFDRRDLRRVGEVEGRIGVLPGSSLAGGVLLYHWVPTGKGKDDGEGEILLVRSATHSPRGQKTTP